MYHGLRVSLFSQIAEEQLIDPAYQFELDGSPYSIQKKAASSPRGKLTSAMTNGLTDSFTSLENTICEVSSRWVGVYQGDMM